MGEFRKEKVPMEDLVKAIHIEVASHQLATAEATIRNFYSASSDKFPGGIRMRLVPEYNGYLNMKSKGKIKHMAAKQLAWINNVRTARTWEIMSMDHRAKENNKTLREMIMEIPTPNKETEMFHSIGNGFRGNGVLLTFVPQYEAEGRMMVAGMLPYLKWRHGDWVEKYFNDGAVVRAQSAEWDEEQQMVITESDKALDDLMGANDDLDLTTGNEQVNFEFESTPGQGRKNVPKPGDDDSVLTFRTKGPKNKPVAQNPLQALAQAFNGDQFQQNPPQPPPAQLRGDVTHASSLSWNSKVTTLETEINTVRSDMSQMQTSVASVEERMVGMASQMERMMSLMGKIAENHTGSRGQHPGSTDGSSAGGGPDSASGH